MTLYYLCSTRVKIIKRYKAHNQLSKEHFPNDESNHYLCEYCGQRFAAENHLESHIRCHHLQTIFLPTREDMGQSSNLNDHNVGNDIEIKQQVLSKLQKQTLNNYITSTKVIIGIDLKEEPIRGIEIKEEQNDYNNSKIQTEDKQNDMYLDGAETEIEKNICDKEIKTDIVKKFTTSCSLKVHGRYHTGEKAYRCDICSKIFTTASGFTAHRRCHTEGKPYSCDICAKKFTTSRSLKAHKRRHTGEKQYSCDICSKKNFTSSGFTAHRRCHTVGKAILLCVM